MANVVPEEEIRMHFVVVVVAWSNEPVAAKANANLNITAHRKIGGSSVLVS